MRQMQAVHLAIFSAIGIAMFSAAFGVGIARLIWADDLQHAQRIDEIRSRTEAALRSRIKIQAQRLGEEIETN